MRRRLKKSEPRAPLCAVISHSIPTARDIYLQIDAREKGWFDAIDGRRTIADIAPAREAKEASRILFERLYCHDQVVFDASGPA